MSKALLPVPRNLHALVTYYDGYIKGGFANQLRSMRMYSDETLQDAVQQFYLDIANRQGWFDSYIQPENKTSERGFKSWLASCIRNSAVNYYRREKSTRETLHLLSASSSEEGGDILSPMPGTVFEHKVDALVDDASYADQTEVENLMRRLRYKMHDETEVVLLVCALLFKGFTPTEIAENLAQRRCEEQGLVYQDLPREEQLRRLSQCKPLVSQYRARIQNKATKLELHTVRSVERTVADYFGVHNIEPFSRPWQFVLVVCRKYGIATCRKLAQRYASLPEERPQLEMRIASIVQRWMEAPSSVQEELAMVEGMITPKTKSEQTLNS